MTFQLADISFPLPVIQAPMAGVQDSELALAVASTGALGSLPCGMLGHGALIAELDRIKASASTVNLNFFCHSVPENSLAGEKAWLELLLPYFEELGLPLPALSLEPPSRRPFDHEVADILEGYAPKIVSFHFGLPEKGLLDRVKSWGSIVLASATTLEEALYLEAHGVDAIIAQGLEAGGHRGMFLSQDVSRQQGGLALIPNIAGRVKVPVIAAGGIADSKGVEAALSLGASAVQVGTAYLLCHEAKTKALHREALKSSARDHTVLTTLFSGGLARGIANRLINELGPSPRAVPPYPLASRLVGLLREAAEQKGLSDFSPLWCGQNARGCQELSAAERTLSLVRGLI